MPRKKKLTIEEVEKQMAELAALHKDMKEKQMEAERLAVQARHISRGALLEKAIPGSEVLPDALIGEFLKQTVQTEYARRVLAQLTGRTPPAGQGGAAAAPGGVTPPQTPERGTRPQNDKAAQKPHAAAQGNLPPCSAAGGKDGAAR